MVLSKIQELLMQSPDSHICADSLMRSSEFSFIKTDIRSDKAEMRHLICFTWVTRFIVHRNPIHSTAPVSQQFPAHKGENQVCLYD